jgi:hypothetical protein
LYTRDTQEIYKRKREGDHPATLTEEELKGG